MSIMPYQTGCAHCEAVKAWHAKMDAELEEIARSSPGKDIVIGVTINAEDVPTCGKHLGLDE